ncbi:MAG: hypothetical protein CM15mP18_1910 [Methanobacteriota archaeon]|nr:MAG: hypothetical protein CM15mP18_1910 [Euryarchaeota archaeon]
MTRNRALFGVHMGTWSRQDCDPRTDGPVDSGGYGRSLGSGDRFHLPAEEAVAAHHHMHDGKNVGKVLLSM